MDKLVADAFYEASPYQRDLRELRFLRDEGLDLLAGFRRITDAGIRRTLIGLVTALADAEEQAVKAAP